MPPLHMPFNSRNLIAWLSLAALAAATVWAVSFRPEPPADFTFVNPAECKSLDPAMVTGQLEGRIHRGTLRGTDVLGSEDARTTARHRRTLGCLRDKLTYTFHIRANAKWTDGSPVTAQDFLWSHRRLLDPQDGLANMPINCGMSRMREKYCSGRVAAGDRVEVELNERPPDALPFARGKYSRGDW